jgi:hypothetical protein
VGQHGSALGSILLGLDGFEVTADPTRLEGVAALGLDETSFLKATRRAPTRYVTGLVDLEGGRLLDVVADRTGAAVDRWLGARPAAWRLPVEPATAGSSVATAATVTTKANAWIDAMRTWCTMRIFPNGPLW